MFDRYTSVDCPRTIEVTEKRAPTDDSIRLGEEYRREIWKSVRDAVVVDLPDIAATGLCVHEPLSGAFRFLFKVNERPFEFEISTLQARIADPNTFVDRLIDGIARRLLESALHGDAAGALMRAVGR